MRRVTEMEVARWHVIVKVRAVWSQVEIASVQRNLTSQPQPVQQGLIV
jgi:hypothetical protein